MFKYFENLVDPYVRYTETDTPPQQVYPFLKDYSRPFYRIFALAALLSIVVAAIEIGLIYYMGRIVDLLGGSPAEVWALHGTELIIVALLILFVRPAIQLVDVLILNNTILPNFGTLIRWRAHKHVLRQSVGWFENDFAGRIANRIMQTPPAAGEVVFQVFDAISFALAYLIGAAILLTAADPRLLLPLAIWFGLYALLVSWTVKRVGPASQAASDARSLVTGRVVDAYTNIHSVKMFAHHESELEYAKDAIEKSRATFQTEMRLYTVMDAVLVTLNGLLIVGVVGWAFVLWMQGTASVGTVAAATALTLRLNAMTGWIMWALTTFFRQIGVVAEGMETIAQPISLVDAPEAKPLVIDQGRITINTLSHHYGRGSGGLDGISLTIEPGEKIGLVGRSGAGKSTLLNCLVGKLIPDTGSVMFDSQSVLGRKPYEINQLGISRVFQTPEIFGDLTVMENMMIPCLAKRDGSFELNAIGDMLKDAEIVDRATHMLEEMNMADKRDMHAAAMSRGDKRRLEIGMCLSQEPRLLLLDEPTAGMARADTNNTIDLLRQIKEERDITIAIIEHDMHVVFSLAERITVLAQGTPLVEDTPENIKGHPKVREAYLGEAA
ncbi:MAG: ATP-binding cassette domain-containing protein [Pseudomonadota bacterium]